MTTEIATTADDSALELLPPARPVKSNALGMLHQHAETMQTAYDLATRLVTTELVPARYRGKPDDATAAILYGCELGLTPIQALQNVFSIHGSPAIYARTMAALLKARGYRFRTVEKTGEVVEVHGWEPGRDPDTQVPDETARWTIEDAERARYTSNQKYQTEPRAMLYAKALAEVCRHLAPDALLGISYSVEELQSERFDDRPTPVAATRSAPITVEEILGAEVVEPAAPAKPDPGRKPPRVIRQPDDDAAPADRAYDPSGEDAGSDAGTEDGPAGPASAAQNRKMHAVFRDVGLTDRQDRLIICGELIGYPLTSSKDLTTVEASTIIDTLERWRDDPGVQVDARLTEILQRWAARQTDSEPADEAEAQADEDGGT